MPESAKPADDGELEPIRIPDPQLEGIEASMRRLMEQSAQQAQQLDHLASAPSPSGSPFAAFGMPGLGGPPAAAPPEPRPILELDDLPRPLPQGVLFLVHARFVRSAAAIALAAAGTLTWAPVASAEPSEPTPSASAAPAETPAPNAGSVEITAKDRAGDSLPGAAFLLLDSTGQEVGRGQSDAQGKLTFPDLAPGIYRLKQTATGSPLHKVVADQDVIVTPGNATQLTITDPFKAAKVLLQAKDDKTGKLLPGATVNIGTGTSTLLTLTTVAKGTASGELPVSSRSTKFWVKEIKAPAGYDLYKPTKTFTAGPGAPVTVTVTNAKTATNPKPDPSDKPTHKPTHSPFSRLRAPGFHRLESGGSVVRARARASLRCRSDRHLFAPRRSLRAAPLCISGQ